MQLLVAEPLERFQSHWSPRAGWRPGRTKYAFHLTMEQCPGVRSLAEAADPVLAACDLLAPVPRQWLHLTMTGVGFSDEVTPEQLQRVAEPVFRAWRDLGPVELVANGLLLAPESVRLVFREDDWLHHLVAVQRAAVDRELGAQPWRRFRPHVSLAYGVAEGDPTPLRAALAELAGQLPERTVDRPSLTLLQLRREQPLYDWTVLPGR